jgi:AraC-like DNA-binding protein
LYFFAILGESVSLPPEIQLAYLGFQLISPSRVLQPYIRSYWHFRRETPLLTARQEYMHPTGGFGIVFNFGDALRLDAQAIADPIFLDGVNTISRKLSFLGHVELMGIRFREGGAYPFLGIPLHELRNELPLLDVLDRPSLLRLHARLYEAESLPARINLLEEWLMGRLALGKARNVLIPASLTMLRAKEGQLPIPELAQKLAISQRQLERLYRSQVGLSPKQYAQLLRVETARLALKHLRGQTLTWLANDLDFYDQAHFIREFKAVIGLTPSAYLRHHRQ